MYVWNLLGHIEAKVMKMWIGLAVALIVGISASLGELNGCGRVVKLWPWTGGEFELKCNEDGKAEWRIDDLRLIFSCSSEGMVRTESNGMDLSCESEELGEEGWWSRCDSHSISFRHRLENFLCHRPDQNKSIRRKRQDWDETKLRLIRRKQLCTVEPSQCERITEIVYKNNWIIQLFKLEFSYWILCGDFLVFIFLLCAPVLSLPQLPFHI